MQPGRRTAVGAVLLLFLPLVACSTDEPTADPTPTPAISAAPSSDPAPTEHASDGRSETLPPATTYPSLPNLMRADFDGRGLRVLRTEYRTDAYTRQQVTYRSNDTTVSGVLVRPHGKGPFPAVVLNHGYIDPSYYVTGQGLAREQDALARAGFVVLHTDYRAHAASDPVPELDRETRLGYTRDAVNAVEALKALPYVDPARLAMLGRSMGGGVTMNALVTQPGLVEAAVIYDSVSSAFLDNLNHFTRPSRPDAVTALFDRFGTPATAPRFYRELSPRTYFDRITEPLLVHHGTADATCPPRWARTTQRLMKEAGVDSRLSWWPGEDHTFYARWQDAMDETVQFLRRRLDG